jgi:type VI secretion system secreted protein VgrG
MFSFLESAKSAVSQAQGSISGTAERMDAASGMLDQAVSMAESGPETVVDGAGMEGMPDLGAAGGVVETARGMLAGAGADGEAGATGAAAEGAESEEADEPPPSGPPAEEPDEEEKVWFYITTPLDGERRKFGLEKIEGEEAISELFHYKLTLKTRDEAVDFNKVLDQPVTVHFEYMSSNQARHIQGIVTRFVQAEFDGEIVTYHAEIRPWLWKLTLSTDARIYQEQNVTDIVKAVFSDLGFGDFKDATTGTYEPREYCVQYGESDFNFVSRLLEDEGIFYFFEHTEDKHTLVLGDDDSAWNPCPDLKSVRLRDVDPEKDDLVESCTFEQELISNKYKAKDYNFETPETSVMAKVDGKVSGKFEVYDYPGGFAATGEGEAIAKKRIEEIEAPEINFKGESYVRAFVAGHTFKFTDHYREAYDGEYVLRRLKIEATDAQYKNWYESFPVKTAFRPPQRTEKPKIHGSQTALVVGKSGEEIWTDKYGRIMVQFHWDLLGKKNEKSSCWVRVGQVWAGKNWGTLFIPRVGAEVIVNFLEGDPDQPIVIGTVYNATQTVPYAQPGEKTKSTIKTNSSKGGKGFNELRFEDKKDSEEIFIHAQKDFNTEVENARTTTVKEADDSLTVQKGNRTVEVTRGNDTFTAGEGHRIVQVKKGNETHTVKGKRTLSVEGKESHTNKADFTQQVKGNFTLKVDGDLTIDVKGAVTIKAGTDMTHKAGKNLNAKAGMNMKHDAGMNLTNKAKMNLTNDAGLNLSNKAKVNVENKANAMLTNKASAMQKVDGGGMLIVKGGLVKIG